MKLNVKDIKKLREETGAGVLEVKQALEKFDGDYKKAREFIIQKVEAKAAKKAGRVANDGLVVSYIHAGGKIGSLLYLGCETDFVAKTPDFQNLAKEIAMQIATSEYDSVEQLYEDEYIRDPSKKIIDLINEVTAKVGEKIEIKDFKKFVVGE